MQLNNKNILKPVKITGNVEISPDVYLVSWRRDADFNPGQVVKIAADNQEPPRIYSICSGTRDEAFSVLFNVKDEGSLTPRMAELRRGDTLYSSPPYGTFTSDDGPAWWIATGTGIAPYYSMFRSGLAGNKVLVHGVRHANQFYFGESFEQEMRGSYFRCCSKEESNGVFHGRVTRYLEQVETFPPGIKYYLCGNAGMVVEVRDFLIERGIPWNQIVAEIYF